MGMDKETYVKLAQQYYVEGRGHHRRESINGQGDDVFNCRRAVFGESCSRMKDVLTGSVDARLLSGDCKGNEGKRKFKSEMSPR